MAHFYPVLLLLWLTCMSSVRMQKFQEESPYMLVRMMDLKVHEVKPDLLDNLEKVLDEELKYKDLKKGIECRKIDFEQEAGYPKQDSRFLDLSFRGICTDERGVAHNIEKSLIIVAIERRIAEVNAAAGAVVYRVGDVQFYKRNRNHLNLIIIPIAVGFILFLFVFTFVLRRLRNSQKKKHIVAELAKKKEAGAKKGLTTANQDPNASERQRLLQLDPTVVGSASGTLGSPKEFTHESNPSPKRNNPNVGGFNRDYQGGAPPVPTKDNRAPYYNREDDGSYPAQRSAAASNRDRSQALYENEPRMVPTQTQYAYDPPHPDMIPMHEHQPRVVVKTIRDDGNHPPYYQQHGEPTSTFVPIPVQVERSGPHQRFVPPPYHSDPYYRNNNA